MNETTIWPLNETTAWQGTTKMDHTTILPDITTIDYTTAGTKAPTTEIPEVWGFISAGIAILFFGSNFVPVKKYETGDGNYTVIDIHTFV